MDAEQKDISRISSQNLFLLPLTSNAGATISSWKRCGKGFSGLTYSSDISDRFFFDLSGNLLIPKRQQSLSTGPLAFNAANTGISIGARLGKFDLVAGAQGGLLWNLRVKSASGNNTYEWLKPISRTANFTGSLTADLRYNLLDFLSLSASVSRNFYQYRIISPATGLEALPLLTRLI
ncbi:MAG: hypothetical protein U5J63_14075 [Fodinibius sp.]|nr:hypothetical protein [Fodinibius sp.]